MNIVAIHTEHDGAVAVVENAELTACIEAQKDNNPRYSPLTRGRFEEALKYTSQPFDVLGVGTFRPYYGCDSSVISVEPYEMDGRMIRRFSTSHERAHIFCAYGLSPFEQGRRCYILIWEGTIGTFCSIDENCEVTRIAMPIVEPGHRYSMLYELAHSGFGEESNGAAMNVAGKLMALASMRDDSLMNADEQETLAALLGDFSAATVTKRDLNHLAFKNIGILDTRFRRFAYKFSAEIFDRFYSVAKANLKNRWPLLIAGGCGLNCDWNSKWRDCGLFENVFVPPCSDDSGCAIGVAVDTQRHFTGNAKLKWDVYAGENFHHDITVPETFERSDLHYERLAQLLRDGAIVAWVQGRYEIGPRALGNRSILAEPFARSTTNRLNLIKERESYRPIAPVCLEREVSTWFNWSGPSPHMLYFHTVRSEQIQAVTHDDASARVQTVNAEQNGPLYELLLAFSRLTGVGVLCNTSLNFRGRGFINRMSTLVDFVIKRDLDAMVVQDSLYTRRDHGSRS